MNKKQSLMAQANQLLQKVKELEVAERQKVGQLVIEMYEKKEIKDEVLLKGIAKIVGDPILDVPSIKNTLTNKNTDEVRLSNE